MTQETLVGTNKVALLVATILLAGPVAAVAEKYTVTKLGTLGGTNSGIGPFSYGLSINASGQVTGYSISNEVGNQIHAFVTDAATNVMTDLGALGGAYNSSYGTGINAGGQVTGFSVTNDFNNPTHAFVTSAATNAMTDLGTLACGTQNYCNGSSYGYAINASGQVTGYSSIATSVFTYHAFITKAATNAMTDLGALGGAESEGYGINVSGQVTGWAAIGSGYGHAFITNAATNAMIDLGTLGGTNSVGYGINASGQVAGYSYIAGNAAQHAFVTKAATNVLADLGTLGGTNSQGLGINSSGQVVGWADTSTNAGHGFLYRNGHMTDLNSLISNGDAALYTLNSGQAINDKGQIVVNATVNSTGNAVALLLTPPKKKPDSE
jgi:probable HAF family extracellular repeat protein